MPRIPSYPLIGAISNDDLMIIDDVSQQYATKSVELQSLKGYFNTGQATIIQVDDRVVTGAAFDANNGLLTLTRNGGDIPSVTTNLDGRYYLSSNPSNYIEGTASTDPSTTAITEIKTLTSAEYASETKLNNVMYVII